MEYNDRPEWVDFDSLLMIFEITQHKVNPMRRGLIIDDESNPTQQTSVDGSLGLIPTILRTCLHQTLCLNHRGSMCKGKARKSQPWGKVNHSLFLIESSFPFHY